MPTLAEFLPAAAEALTAAGYPAKVLDEPGKVGLVVECKVKLAYPPPELFPESHVDDDIRAFVWRYLDGVTLPDGPGAPYPDVIDLRALAEGRPQPRPDPAKAGVTMAELVADYCGDKPEAKP